MSNSNLNKENRTFTLNNTSFIFENKFFIDDIKFVNVVVLEYNLYEDPITKEKNIIFSQSRSECGMWRLCVTKPENVGPLFRLQKGIHYTMSAFIILELQMFLSSIIDNLPEVSQNIQPCIDQYKFISKTLSNTKRHGIPIDIERCEFDYNSLKKIGDYEYIYSLLNPHPVNMRVSKSYSKLKLENKKKVWPSENANNIRLYESIQHGNTEINLNGTIYSVELKHIKNSYIFYYMIYNCEIKIPESLTESTSPNNKEYNFKNSINIKNYIIPIYLIPYPKTYNDINNKYLEFGLYDKYIPMKFKNKNIDFCKILDYIQHCRKKNFDTLPICTTSYKFIGGYYDYIFKDIKENTLRLLRIKKRQSNKLRQPNTKQNIPNNLEEPKNNQHNNLEEPKNNQHNNLEEPKNNQHNNLEEPKNNQHNNLEERKNNQNIPIPNNLRQPNTKKNIPILNNLGQPKNNQNIPIPNNLRQPNTKQNIPILNNLGQPKNNQNIPIPNNLYGGQPLRNNIMCTKYDKKTISAGTILYNGISTPTNKCPSKYKYKNKNNYDNKYILYTSDDFEVAKGYALSCLSNEKGWIRHYVVKNNITLADISKDKLHYEVNEVINNFCDCDGYYLDWGGKNGKEIVLCDPEKNLKFVGLYKCTGMGEYKKYNCNNNQSGGNKKTKDKKYNEKSNTKNDKRLGKYKHKNHTHKTKKAMNNCKR